MDDFIFKPTSKQDVTISQYYCMVGNQDYTDDSGLPRLKNDSSLTLAKKIEKTDAQPQFFIKISNQNKLFNPLDSGLEDKSYSIVDNVCRPSDKFKSVNSTVFAMYLNFLSSKNIAWLNKAEREMI
jgi:hypothetical protein